MKIPELKMIYRWSVTQIWYRLFFKKIGAKSILYKPLMLTNAQYITLGERTIIRDAARIELVARPDVKIPPQLNIGNNVNIEQGAHIICQGNIEIGDNVSITPYCIIVDVTHPFDRPDVLPKIGSRLNGEASFVTIGEGCFIGARSIILPNVALGAFCVVAAGSIVTKDAPPYSLLSGAPARVVKRYDVGTQEWIPV